MNILDKIIVTKKQEVERQKKLITLDELKNSPHFSRTCNSLKAVLKKSGSSGIIAEFKQKSPSKGVINSDAKVEEVTLGYANAGAVCLSVLTDSEYFGGSAENLMKARQANPEIPILRKDFMVDVYQIYEAKSWGADLILLIAACLEKDQAKTLAITAKKLGMEVLMEIHYENELEVVNEFVDFVGVNNRNLKTFDVSIETSKRLAALIPKRVIKISESGIENPETIRELKDYGFKGFLIGENFMKTSNPGETCKKFISVL